MKQSYEKKVRVLSLLLTSFFVFGFNTTNASANSSNNSDNSQSIISSSVSLTSDLSTTKSNGRVVHFISSDGNQLSQAANVVDLDNGMVKMPSMTIPGYYLKSVYVGTKMYQSNKVISNLTQLSSLVLPEQQLDKMLGTADQGMITLNYQPLSQIQVVVHFTDENGNSIGQPDQMYEGTSAAEAFTITPPEIAGYQSEMDLIPIDFADSHVVTVRYSKITADVDSSSDSSGVTTENSSSSSQGVDSNSSNIVSALSGQSNSSEGTSVVSNSQQSTIVSASNSANNQSSSVVSDDSSDNKQTSAVVKSSGTTADSKAAATEAKSQISQLDGSSSNSVQESRNSIVNSVLMSTSSKINESSNVKKVSGQKILKQAQKQLPGVMQLSLSLASVVLLVTGISVAKRRH